MSFIYQDILTMDPSFRVITLSHQKVLQIPPCQNSESSNALETGDFDELAFPLPAFSL